MSGRDRDNSLCEKSMKMVVNIVKLSSFSIARMSLGATGSPSVVTKNTAAAVMDVNQPGSRKSQELRMRKQPFSVVMQPDEGKGGSYVIHEDNSVIDGMTSDYIRKFHEKNRYMRQQNSLPTTEHTLDYEQSSNHLSRKHLPAYTETNGRVYS